MSSSTGGPFRFEFGGRGRSRIFINGQEIPYRPPGIDQAELARRIKEAVDAKYPEIMASALRTIAAAGQHLTDAEFRNVVKIAARVAETQQDPVGFALRWVLENRPKR